MVAPTVGSVVLLPFPFSDLSASKLRPALALADSGNRDWICFQITSNPYSDSKAIELTSADFVSSNLNGTSHIRPGKVFTASEILCQRAVAEINKEKLASILEAVISLLRS